MEEGVPCGVPPEAAPPPPPRQLFFNGTEPLGPEDPFPWPALAATLETVAREGAEALYSGRLGRMLLEDIAREGEPPAGQPGPRSRASTGSVLLVFL